MKQKFKVATMGNLLLKSYFKYYDALIQSHTITKAYIQ